MINFAIKIIKSQLLLFILIIPFYSSALSLENKIVLKIDNDIITTLDIFNEINALKFFNTNLNKVSKEEIYQIALETL